MHNLSASFVLGYHGCARDVAESLLSGETTFEASQNEFDWLGAGIYFWEANPRRGLEFAEEQRNRGKFADPYVVGATLDLEYCLDLTTSMGVEAVSIAYESFASITKLAQKPMPKNRGGPDSLLRELDCAVVNHLHQIKATSGKPFDSVRGVFLAEGGQIYEGSGFYKKTHIQVCMRNLSCIKGIFRVPNEHLAGV